MPYVKDIIAHLETLAPGSTAESWDNVGLLCGSGDLPVTKILVALDPFLAVCQEAAELGADLIVTHHPLIFSPLKSITDQTSTGRCIRTLIANGIAAVNAHTNLDVAPGGVNDVLARVLGLEDVQVLFPTGTDRSSNPVGLLRAGIVEAQSLSDFLARVKENLHCPGLRYCDGGKPVRRVAVGGGACASELTQAAQAGCDTFVTADVKYNQFWDAQDLGINLIDAGHFYTENPVVAVLAENLAAAFPEIPVFISKKHRDCMKFF